MPSLPDTAVIILLGLLLFGPKGLAQIARQIGKLMGEFRRASNEFRMQMEEELRISEQTDRQKEIAAIQVAAPVPPVISTPEADYTEEHPHLPPAGLPAVAEAAPVAEGTAVPLPIASSGDLSIMPPSTGLPEPRSSSLSSLIDAVPKVEAPDSAANGDAASSHPAFENERTKRYDQVSQNGTGHQVAAEESLHG